MASMTDFTTALKVVPTIFVALFPIMNPIGTAMVLYGMTGNVEFKAWRSASRKIALYCFLLLTLFFFAGRYVLALFGISIPIMRFAGGMVVASIGWGLLNQKDPGDSQRQEGNAESTASLQSRLFYPYTFPITVGPGSLAVVLAFSAELYEETGTMLTMEQGAAVVGLFAVCVFTAACYTNLKFIIRKFSPAGAQALSRILAFFLFCIGVEIAWMGWRALNAA
jgi:multiple antibiotic resistance protein